MTDPAAAQLRAVSARLRAVGSEGKVLQRRVNKTIRAAVEPMRGDVQRAILATPAKGEDHHAGRPGLRAAAARATRIRTRTSGRSILVRLQVVPSMMPAGMETLPARLDGRKRWNHPTYGHQDRWVTQPSHPYFERTVRPRVVEVRIAVRAAVQSVADSF